MQLPLVFILSLSYSYSLFALRKRNPNEKLKVLFRWRLLPDSVNIWQRSRRLLPIIYFPLKQDFNSSNIFNYFTIESLKISILHNIITCEQTFNTLMRCTNFFPCFYFIILLLPFSVHFKKEKGNGSRHWSLRLVSYYI